MSDTSPLPSAKAVRDLLEGLLGREVEVRTGGDQVDPSTDAGALVGVYVDRLLKLRALCLLDVPAAARIGAAIGLVPARVADESALGDFLDPGLEENAREVLNVFASLFNAPDAPHVRLDTVIAAREPLPRDVAPWVRAYVPRNDLVIDVAGYGPGGVSVLVL